MVLAIAPSGGRMSVEGLVNPRPLGREVPALLQEDDFCLRLLSALDEVIAPVFATLDCIASYLDPALTPEDFVDYLAGWVGVEVDETWPIERRRRLLWEVAALYRIRGTAAGLASHVALYTGGEPEIIDSGGCSSSQVADTPLPGSADPHVTVRVRVPEPDAINQLTLDRIVASSRPAHVPYTVEIGAAKGRLVAAAVVGQTAGDASDDAPGAVDLPQSERIHLPPPGAHDESPEDPEPTT